jgi:hypothetical protein
LLRLKTKIKINSRVEAKCDRHIRYNPEKDGRGGIKAGCTRCEYLYAIFNTWQTFQNAMRDYQQMTAQFEKVKPRVKKPAAPPAPGGKSQTQGWLDTIKSMGEEERKKK